MPVGITASVILDVKSDILGPALAELKWSQADLAQKLSVHRNTVSGWMTGRLPLPGYAIAYLNLALSLERLRP